MRHRCSIILVLILYINSSCPDSFGHYCPLVKRRISQPMDSACGELPQRPQSHQSHAFIFNSLIMIRLNCMSDDLARLNDLNYVPLRESAHWPLHAVSGKMASWRDNGMVNLASVCQIPKYKYNPMVLSITELISRIFGECRQVCVPNKHSMITRNALPVVHSRCQQWEYS
jgi:hypothetical protein